MTDPTLATTPTDARPLDHGDAGATTLFALHGVSRTFGSPPREVHALRDIDLEIADGEYVVIVGPSGSGKSTLLQLLAALDRPTAGEIELDGRDLAALDDRELSRIRSREIGIIFQQFNLIPTLSAIDNVAAALAPAGVTGEALRARAADVLAEVGLSHRMTHLPSQLSGGEQQRVAIARALANRPRVLLADEPTGNLDSATGRDILGLLADLSAQGGQTIVLITHDDEVATSARRLIRMRDGGIQTPPTGDPSGSAPSRPVAGPGGPVGGVAAER